MATGSTARVSAGVLPRVAAKELDGDLSDRLRRYARNHVLQSRARAASAADRSPDLRTLLVDELTSIGARDVMLTNDGAVLATIPATVETGVPTIAFLVPLLGPDENAGAAIIVTLAGYLLHHPDLPHGAIRMGFAADEEIGRGLHRDVTDDSGADVAYTFKPDEPAVPVADAFTMNHKAPGPRESHHVEVENGVRIAEMCIEVVRSLSLTTRLQARAKPARDRRSGLGDL